MTRSKAAIEHVLKRTGKPIVTWADDLEAIAKEDGSIHIQRSAGQEPVAPYGPFGFAEAVRRVAARSAMYVARQEQLSNGVYQTRQLLVTMGGHLYLRIDGHDEQRHLTARDVQATDWRETL